jgi:hypothetical protein
MIPKSGNRFSEKIMLNENVTIGPDSIKTMQTPLPRRKTIATPRERAIETVM